jgi:hypothetical protein
MMLKYGEINPLNVFGLRRVEHCPPHFEQVHFNLHVNDKKITDWILVEEIGAGQINFTWNGTVCTTNEPKPQSLTNNTPLPADEVTQ